MRRLVVCCDGTWNRADWEGGTATNVVRIARAVTPMAAGAIAQIVYYHPGVGTGNQIDRLLGGGLGFGLSQNVRDAYAFLVNNHAPGDEILLFGFSRGAYTARSLGGLIGTIGLLDKQEMGGFMDAWAFHRLDEKERARHQAAFDERFPARRRDVAIRCIAVWDTVGALGIPANRFTHRWEPCRSTYRFHDTTLGPHVAHAFQALAIDEQRHPFAPVVWTPSAAAPATQVLVQMWFAGVHSDVGGGYREHGASDVALVWIVAQLVERGLLELDEAALAGQLDRRRRYGTGPLHRSLTWLYRVLSAPLHRAVARSPSEHVHDTVRQRIDAGGYRDRAFLERHAGKLAPLLPLEARLGSDAVAPFTERPPLLPERRTLCDRLVRWLMGE
jgi:uncharacterized protein (DUF2235 family)